MSIVLAILEGKDAGREFVFERLPILVGRTKACNVVLYHPSISRRHCRFYKEDEHVFVEDLRSINGTFVNGVPVLLNSVLGSGDIVGLGSLKFRFDTLKAEERTELVESPKQDKSAQEHAAQSNGAQEHVAQSNGAQEHVVQSKGAQKHVVQSKGAWSKAACELATLDQLFAFKPTPVAPEQVTSSFLAFEKTLPVAPQEKSFSEKKSAEEKPAEEKPEQNLAPKNLLEEILPEEIEGILPEEFLSEENMFEEGFFEEKLPEELLAEETLARENLKQNLSEEKGPEKTAEETCGEEIVAKKTAEEACCEEIVAEKTSFEESFSEEKQPKQNPVEPTPSKQNHLFEQLLSDEQKLLEEISVEQELLSKQKWDEESLVAEKLPSHPLVEQNSLGFQLHTSKLSRHVLKHPILFTGLGSLLCVLFVLLISRL